MEGRDDARRSWGLYITYQCQWSYTIQLSSEFPNTMIYISTLYWVIEQFYRPACFSFLLPSWEGMWNTLSKVGSCIIIGTGGNTLHCWFSALWSRYMNIRHCLILCLLWCFSSNLLWRQSLLPLLGMVPVVVLFGQWLWVASHYELLLVLVIQPRLKLGTNHSMLMNIISLPSVFCYQDFHQLYVKVVRYS